MPHPHEQGLPELTNEQRGPFITGETEQQQTQETFLPDEKKAAFRNLNQTLDDPFGGTGIQSIIQTLLESLAPGEQEQRQTQADLFRRLGGRSGPAPSATRLAAASKLEGTIGRNRSTTAAEGLLKFLAPLLQGRSAALQGIPALSKSQSTSSSKNFGFAPRATSTSRAALPRAAAAPSAERGLIDFNPVFDFDFGGGGGGGGDKSGSGGQTTPVPVFDPGAVAFAPGGGQPFAGSGSSVDRFRQFSKEPLAPSTDFVPDFDFLFGR